MKPKIVKLNAQDVQPTVDDAIALNEYRKEFKANGFEFSDEQLIKIRAFFQVMAQIAFEQYERQQELKDNATAKIVKLQNENEYDTKGNLIHSGEYRRAG